MEASRKKAGAWTLTVLLAGIILLLAVPLLYGAAYTYPAADDFITENGTTEWANTLGPVRGRLLAAWNFYMTWEGRYLSNLLLFLISPFTRFGLNGFRIIMVMLSLFFVLSLFFMVHGIVDFSQPSRKEEYGDGRRNKKLFLYAVLLFAALGLPGTWIGKEIFYWYTAALGYLIGINFLFLSIGCLLLANCREKKKGYYIFATLFGFLASGVSPQVASFVCSWLLLVLLALFLSAKTGEKRISLWDIWPFAVSFLGALINAAAPGSLKRSQSTMGDVPYGVGDAIRDSLNVQRGELKLIWHDPLFIALVVIVLFFCICFEVRVVRNGRPLTWMGALLMCGGALVSQFLCIFPVILGYHGGGLSNERTQYVADFEIRFSLLFAVMYLGQYLARILPEKVKRGGIFYLTGAACSLLVCAGGFLFCKGQPEEIFSGYSFELIKEISDGTVQEVFNLRREVLEALEAAEEGTDVCLQMPAMPESLVTYPQGITEGADYLVNQAVASLFHLNSVAVMYGGD